MFKVERPSNTQCSHTCSGSTDVVRQIEQKVASLDLVGASYVDGVVASPKASIDLANRFKVGNSAPPTNPRDLVSKEYVDDLHTIAIEVIQKTNLLYSKGTTSTTNHKSVTSFFNPGVHLEAGLKIYSATLTTVPVANAAKQQILNMLIKGSVNNTIKDKVLVKDVTKDFFKVTFQPPLEVVEDSLVVFHTHDDSASVGENSGLTIKIGT